MHSAEVKAALRREALARRDALPPETRAAAAARIAALDLPFRPAPGLVVSGFWPIRSEIDVRPLMARLAEAGCRLALPRIQAGALVFRLWRPGDALEPAGFGTRVPSLTAEVLAPEVMLVPLLAFDRRGGRVGYGKGYYDGAIARLAPRLTVGLAFAVQEVEAVPMDAHDRHLDFILTEQGCLDCRRKTAPPAA